MGTGASKHKVVKAMERFLTTSFKHSDWWGKQYEWSRNLLIVLLDCIEVGSAKSLASFATCYQLSPTESGTHVFTTCATYRSHFYDVSLLSSVSGRHIACSKPDVCMPTFGDSMTKLLIGYRLCYMVMYQHFLFSKETVLSFMKYMCATDKYPLLVC